MCITENFACSDHFPLCVTILCDISPICISTADNEFRNIPEWNQVSDSDIYTYTYKCNTHKLSPDIPIPTELLLCNNTDCSIHNEDIDLFYKSIMSVFKKATTNCIPSSGNSSKHCIPIPG